jgi:hypothetical protein
MDKTKTIKLNVKELVNCYEGESCHVTDACGGGEILAIKALALDGDQITIEVTVEQEED